VGVQLTRYCPSDKIKKIETGGACGMCGREESFVQSFGGGKIKERITW
jgi:hypothetical protein